MSYSQLNKRLRLGLALLASGGVLGLGGPAWAQTGFGAQYREDPGTALSRHLKTLADSPRNLSALTGAAKAALDLGDAQAAMTFYARAEAVAPRDGRIKAGIGSAFVAMEQPQPALRFFDEARGLGAPEGEYAADRGLAYDLLGDPVQAQRDYLLAMRTHDNDELRRRLALSKAISGDRAGAIAAIDGQLRRQDRAAWRVRALVLALTGDTAGATEAARSAMPQQAAAMQPFFARLPSLRPADRAMAVHFGHFPGEGAATASYVPQTYASVSPSLPPAITDAGRPSVAQPAFGGSSALVAGGPRRAISGPVLSQPVRITPSTQAVSRPVETASRPSRQDDNPLRDRWSDSRGISRPRTSGAAERVQPTLPSVAAVSTPVRQPTAQSYDQQPTAIARSTTPPSVPGVTVPIASAGVQGPPVPDGLGQVATMTSASTPAPAVSSPIASLPATVSATVLTSASAPAVAVPTASVVEQAPVAQINATPAPVATTSVSVPTPVLASASAATGRLSGLAALIESLPDTEPEPANASASKASKVSGRHWVQIASAPDSLVTSEYRRLKRKHSELLSDKDGFRAPMGKSNRVLVGPFASASGATEFVGRLRKSNLTAVTWTSAEGQVLEALASR